MYERRAEGRKAACQNDQAILQDGVVSSLLSIQFQQFPLLVFWLLFFSKKNIIFLFLENG